MARVANASFAADGLPTRRTPDEMARDYANFTGCKPFDDVLLLEIDDELVAYARCWRWLQPDGLMLHAQFGLTAGVWRGKGLERALLAWCEARHRAVAAERRDAKAHEHHAFVEQSEKARSALLESCGYEARRFFLTMTHPDPASGPDFALPAGIELRAALPEHYQLIWQAHQEAFKDHWGGWAPGPDDYAAWLASRVFQPQHWQIAWDVAANAVVGQVRTFIDDEQNRAQGRRRGYTEFISVLRPWRRRGLARALVAESLRTLARAGMTESALGVDSENSSGATRLYEDCGFRVVSRGTVYRKPLLIEA